MNTRWRDKVRQRNFDLVDQGYAGDSRIQKC